MSPLVPASVFASCLVIVPWSLARSPEEDPKPTVGRKLILETVGGAKGALPRALRVTLKNTSKDAVSCTEPSPVCPEALEEGREAPVLGLQLVDEKGRESQFPPILTELSKLKVSPPKTVTLKPGEAWSKEYPLASFHFWGPCGPAAPVPELMKPGPSQIKVAAFLAFKDGSRTVSGSFAAAVKIPEGLFEAPTAAKSVEEVDEYFRLMAKPVPFPGERPPLAEYLKWLRKPEFDLHLHAANEIRLRGLEAKEAVPAILDLLRSRDDRDRLAALYALEGIGPGAKDALPNIQDLWRDPNVRVREKAEETAAAIQGKPAPSKAEPMYAGKPVTYWIAEASRRHEPGRDDREERDDDPERRVKARHILAGMGSSAVPKLIEALGTDDRDVRWTVTEVLRKLRDDGKVPDDAWLNGLKSRSVLVRRGVAEALGPDRWSTQLAPGANDLSPPVVSALLAALKDSDSDVNLMAVRALGRRGLKASVPALLEVLKSPSFELRRSAAASLGHIGSREPEVLSALKWLVNDEHAYVRSAVGSALKELGVRDSGHVDFTQRIEEYMAQRTAKEEIRETSERTLDPLPVNADGVFFVVARSPSSREAFRLSKEYIPKVLERLPPEAEFGIVFADQGAIQYPKGLEPARAGEKEKAEALTFVKATQGGISSCPMEGLHAALSFAERSSVKRKVILYMGNGGGTCSFPTPEADYLELTCDAITLRNRGIAEIHALGVNTTPMGEGFLLYFTEKNGGTYTRLQVKEEGLEKKRR